MAGCHTLLICAHLCLSVGGFLCQKVLCVLCILWELSLFALLVLQRQLHQRGSILPRISRISTECWAALLAAWVWQGCHTLLICAHLCLSVGGFLCQTVLCVPRILWEYIPACSVGALETSAPPLEVALTALLVYLWAAHLRRFPSATQSVSVRRPIRFRSPPGQIASAARCHK